MNRLVESQAKLKSLTHGHTWNRFVCSRDTGQWNAPLGTGELSTVEAGLWAAGRDALMVAFLPMPSTCSITQA